MRESSNVDCSNEFNDISQSGTSNRGTMGTLCSKRVDKLETMFFGAFQAYSTALYDFKWVFCKKKNFLVVPHIFQNFKPTIRG